MRLRLLPEGIVFARSPRDLAVSFAKNVGWVIWAMLCLVALSLLTIGVIFTIWFVDDFIHGR